MKKFDTLSIIFFVFFLLFSGCEKKDFTKSPPIMHWDRDMCERCKMAISERKYAVIGIGEDGRVYKFDDIGCLILWQKKEKKGLKFKKIWITDAKTGEWIDAKKAFYSTTNITPMGYGFGAHKDRKNLEGEIIDYKEVEKRILAIGR